MMINNINTLLETNDTPPSDLSTTNELGAELRQLREQKGLSIKEVADRLKLPARQIEALENGSYEGLPEPVFIRGFLRSYGRFLDMDEERLSRYLDHIAPATHMRHTQHEQHDLNFTNTTVKKSSPKWIFAVMALAVVAAGVYFWQMKSNEENDQQKEVSTIPDNSDVVPPNLNTDNVIVKPMTASDTATETATSATPNTTPNSPANAILSSSAPAAVAGTAGELVITPKHRTMLTVTDVNGKVQINKIVPAMEEHRFKEGAPFEVRMGYANGATASFAGTPIDIEAQRKDGSKSVVFTAGAPAKK